MLLPLGRVERCLAVHDLTDNGLLDLGDRSIVAEEEARVEHVEGDASDSDRHAVEQIEK